ncbi:MAG TPA: energy-coupling factor transporter transmembrane component T, partial [Spirochaetota bacterium]|nr:energy-coupling factor transporter transmembrane component T [Spirochaetota bacterium]
FAAAVFSFAVLLSSVFFNGYNGWNLCIFISVKVFMSVMSVKILSATTRWDSITRALRIAPVPDIFILVLDISLRYIVMLGELTLDMFIALKLRSIGRNRAKNRALGGVAGSIFLFSRAMAEDMYAAMTCRGFTGTYRIRRGIRPRPVDFAFIAANGLMVWFFLSFGRL